MVRLAVCGIAGWAFGQPDESKLRRALARLAQRGPDGEGTWSRARVSLGHRRLAVIDLTERGRQPMADPSTGVTVTYNGEIYNFAALRKELSHKYQFRSGTDTEVLVHGYAEWGIEGLLQRLSGMFAFALWDERRGVLHLARDRVGKKPLFYALTGGTLLFASTLPALLELLPATPPLRADAVADYLHYQCVPADKCMVEGVAKLLPAHHATFDGAKLEIRRYWRLRFDEQERRTTAEWVDLIDRELSRATAERLVSDVPLGVFLSGGVDSSIVTAMTARASPRPITTIAAGFDDASYDELKFARMVAERYRTDHQEHMIRADAAADLPRLVYATGEPLADAATLPTMLLSRAAKRSVTVVLTGDGGDEGFAGYPHALIARVAHPYARLFPRAVRRDAVPRLLDAADHIPRAAGLVRKLRRLALSAREGPVHRYDMLATHGFRGRLGELCHPTLAARLEGYDPDGYWDQTLASASGPTFADRVLELETVALLPDMFLAKADSASMAYGVELRSPFLDFRLLELAARIPIAQKLEGFKLKALLKRLAVRLVPRRAVLRPKHGFSVPLAAWLRGPLVPLARELLLGETLARRQIVDGDYVRHLFDEHQRGAANHGDRLYTLLVLEIWVRMFIDKTMSPDDALL